MTDFEDSITAIIAAQKAKTAAEQQAKAQELNKLRLNLDNEINTTTALTAALTKANRALAEAQDEAKTFQTALQARNEKYALLKAKGQADPADKALIAQMRALLGVEAAAPVQAVVDNDALSKFQEELTMAQYSAEQSEETLREAKLELAAKDAQINALTQKVDFIMNALKQA